MIDFKAVARLCAEIGYEGWFVVEAETGPEEGEPAEIRKDRPRRLGRST